MSENVVHVPQFLREAQPEAVAAGIPAARHLIAAAVLLERVRSDAAAALLGLQNCPASAQDINGALNSVIGNACEAEKAYAAYSEVIACRGRA